MQKFCRWFYIMELISDWPYAYHMLNFSSKNQARYA